MRMACAGRQFNGGGPLCYLAPHLLEPTMPRNILDEAHIHPAIRGRIDTHRQAIVDEVKAAVAANSVVVVGMGMNPFPRKARAALDAVQVPYKYLEYGNYLNTWRDRGALKMWSGWPPSPWCSSRARWWAAPPTCMR